MTFRATLWGMAKLCALLVPLVYVALEVVLTFL